MVRDYPASLARSSVALDALLMSSVCTPSFTKEQLHKRTPHSLKGLVPSVGKCRGESDPCMNEMGKWDGSSSQLWIDKEALGLSSISPSGEDEFRILQSYTSVGAEEQFVPDIMERQVASMRARVLAVPDEELPAVGGFAYYASMN